MCAPIMETIRKEKSPFQWTIVAKKRLKNSMGYVIELWRQLENKKFYSNGQ